MYIRTTSSTENRTMNTPESNEKAENLSLQENETEQTKYQLRTPDAEENVASAVEIQGALWKYDLRKICLAALWLPLGALIVCFTTAFIFQQDDIHETHCRVYNVIPSISAITGISPQRYLWRICIAFHLGPRLLVGSLYYSYHKKRASYIQDEKNRLWALRMGEACYWLNLIELFALTGVTYVSNRENYYVHEKIFIVFMVAALLHMLLRAKVGCVDKQHVAPVRSNRVVWVLFGVAIAATAGLIVFFLRHRLLCRPLAFTWFSVCEYILATANMAFHAIVVKDLPEHHLQVVRIKDNDKNE